MVAIKPPQNAPIPNDQERNFSQQSQLKSARIARTVNGTNGALSQSGAVIPLARQETIAPRTPHNCICRRAWRAAASLRPLAYSRIGSGIQRIIDKDGMQLS